jgi:hypothetical protein
MFLRHVLFLGCIVVSTLEFAAQQHQQKTVFDQVCSCVVGGPASKVKTIAMNPVTNAFVTFVQGVKVAFCWNVQGEQQFVIKPDEGEQIGNTIQWSPDGRFLAMVADGRSQFSLTILNTEGKRVARHECARPIRTITWSLDARYIALSFLDGIDEVFDREKGQLVQADEQASKPGFFVGQNADGSYIFSSQGRITLIDADSAKALLRSMSREVYEGSCLISATQCVGWAQGVGGLIDVFEKEEVALPQLAWEPGPRKMITWKASTTKQIDPLHRILVSPCGRFLATEKKNNTVEILDVTTLNTVVSSAHMGELGSSIWSKQGNYLLARPSLYEVAIINLRTNKVVRIQTEKVIDRQSAVVVEARAGFVSAQCSPDERFVVTRDSDNQVKIWDIERNVKDADCLQTVPRITTFSWSANGENPLLVLGSVNDKRLATVTVYSTVLPVQRAPAVHAPATQDLHHANNTVPDTVVPPTVVPVITPTAQAHVAAPVPAKPNDWANWLWTTVRKPHVRNTLLACVGVALLFGGYRRWWKKHQLPLVI